MKKIITLITVAFLLFLTGCAISGKPEESNNANLLGIIKYEGASYSSVGPNTVTISSDELIDRKNFSGRKTTLLWGLITLKDY